MPSYFFQFLKYSILLLACLSIGCGYRIRVNGEPMGIELESLAIPLITSSSSVKGFEADFTRVIREEFISHSKIPIVPIEKAHAVLKGNIYLVSSEPIAYELLQTNVSNNQLSYSTTSRRKLRINMDISLTDRRTGKLIWRERSLKEEANFNVGTNPLSNTYFEKQALEKIAGLLAKRIYLKTLERF